MANETSSTSSKIGAVMVVGGGIAGMQSALDLAEMGFLVHLVERNPAIGGRMAQLDKVFPTNDCAMCIISPKLNDAGGNLNINVMNNSEVMGISGKPGNFKVKVRKKPRFIDSTKCTACGDCAKACPVELPSEFNQGLNGRRVTYKSYAQAYPNSYSLTKEGVSPCVLTCPAHVNAHGYVSLAGEGRWQEALEVIMDVLPLPSSLGRICAHPCETECRRRQMEAPLAIRDIKRLVAEKGDMKAAGETFVKEEPKTSGQVAIIGAGPAGLTCAYHLSRRGHKAVIFDKAQTAGGALRLGIPDYRLSPKVLQEEIDFILEFSGAELKLGKTLGVDFTIDDLFQQGFKAVFIATGAGRDFSLGLPGEDSAKIITCGKFLGDVNFGQKPDLTGKRVLVLGGGNVAMDVARSAVRCGAKAVTAACREGRSIMPAWAWEVHEAEEEGVRVVVLRTPKGFEETGKGIKAKMGLMVDNKDPRNFVEDPSGDLWIEEFDLIIRSLGQLPSTELFKDKSAGVEFGRADSIVVDPITLQTGRAGVFAGGDVRTGAKLAIDAVAAGKEVAISIDRFLAGQDLAAGREPMTFTGKEQYRDVPLHEAKKARANMPARPAEERRRDWEEFELGLSEEVCLAEAKRCISCGSCCQCYRCVKACLPQAVTVETHAQKDEIIELEVGSVVMATGFDPFDPANSETYRYSQCPNVVTSMEFERILSASGPFQGHMVRPGDHKEPARIAWLQCVGSRDLNRCDNRYCSAVCCMYAIKEAVIAKEHAGGNLDATIFYMDVRTYGKDFEKYYNRAQEAGVNFVRSRVHTLTPQLNGDVALDYIEESGERKREFFDMVVLSVGLNPSATLPELARNLGVELNEDGFVATGHFTPVTTSRPGIHACGAVNEPKDIPYTVMEASAAAEAASREIYEVRGTLARSVTYPDERDVTGETPRIGVFVCHCGINIASIIDVEAVTAYAASLPFVEVADRNLFTCSQDTQGKIKAAIIENKLNRVVVASCSPRTHEPMFRETLAQAGINKYLFEMANIRDHDSWVHQKEPDRATAKAKDLVRGAVAKAALLEPMYQTQMGLVHEALVIGGGATGLTAALSLAEQGFPVHLVEATGELGGQARRLFTRGKDVQQFLDDLIQKVRNNSNVHLYMNSRPKFSGGFLGNFETVVAGPKGEETTIKHGVTILSAGGAPHEPHSYLYGEHPKVILALDLDAKLKAGDPALTAGRQTFAFVQCVESREPDRPYCSKVCCTHSLENALTILDRNPEALIYILYRDVRAYGYREKLYQEARSRGVRFIRYDTEDKPVLENGPDGRVRVTVKDHVLGRPVVIDADLVTLASGIDPTPMRDLVEIFKGQLTAEGFLLEAHMKLLPVDLATHGQYLAGLAHYPKPLEESLTQARAVAARASGTLGHDHIMVGGIVAVVDPKKCAVCCTCVRACPVSVPRIVPNEEDKAARGNAYMEPAICQGCGVCVSECPGKAIKLQFFTDDQMVAKIAAMASGGQKAGAAAE